MQDLSQVYGGLSQQSLRAMLHFLSWGGSAYSGAATPPTGMAERGLSSQCSRTHSRGRCTCCDTSSRVTKVAPAFHASRHAATCATATISSGSFTARDPLRAEDGWSRLLISILKAMGARSVRHGEREMGEVHACHYLGGFISLKCILTGKKSDRGTGGGCVVPCSCTSQG